MTTQMPSTVESALEATLREDSYFKHAVCMLWIERGQYCAVCYHNHPPDQCSTATDQLRTYLPGQYDERFTPIDLPLATTRDEAFKQLLLAASTRVDMERIPPNLVAVPVQLAVNFGFVNLARY